MNTAAYGEAQAKKLHARRSASREARTPPKHESGGKHRARIPTCLPLPSPPHIVPAPGTERACDAP
eukprot:3166846-Prorocentrum_lima.AAC.1